MFIDNFGGLNTICLLLVREKIIFQAREGNIS